MTPRCLVLPAADDDLDRQAEYLAHEASLETALRFYEAARSTFGRLAGMPNVGERHESRSSRLAGLRKWRVEGFENHVIFYLVDDEGITIVRVLHAARDLDRA